MIVAGAGASGLMAALQAARGGARVLVLEQGRWPARKLAMLRRGRGSLTHADVSHERFGGKHARFAGDALSEFDTTALHALAAEFQIELIDEEGTLLPESRSGHDFARALIHAVNQSGASILHSTHVHAARKTEQGFAVQTSRGEFKAARLLLALGAPHFPQLGGADTGLNVARSFGHTLETHHPALVGVRTREVWPFRLPGLWMECGITLHAGGKSAAQHRGLVLFTAGALAGPGIAAVSREVEAALALNQSVELWLNFYPELTPEEVTTWMFRNFGQSTRKFAPDALNPMLPRRLATEVCRVAGVDPAWRVDRLTVEQRAAIEARLTKTVLHVTGTLGWRAAEATRGGVNVREINPRSFESKRVPGLFIAGEMLDVDADNAAMNVHFALASGWCAGSAAAKR